MTDQEKANHLTFTPSVSEEKLHDGPDWLLNEAPRPRCFGMLDTSFNSSQKKIMYLSTNACKVKGEHKQNQYQRNASGTYIVN